MLALFRGDFAGNGLSNSRLALVRLASAVALRCCVLFIVLGAAGSLSAADDRVEARPTPQRSSLFRLPGFLKRDRKSNATAKPAQPNPSLTRATQLLVQAKTYEANGKPAVALELARRAESIIKASSHTTGTRWPSRSQSPSQYIAALSQRIGVADKPLVSIADSPTFADIPMFADDPTFGDSPPFSDDPQPQAQPSPPTTEPPGPTAARLPEEVGAQSAVLSNSAPQEQQQTSVPVLAIRPQPADSGDSAFDWGDRSRTSKVQLTGATQPEQPSSTSDGTTDETSLLFRRLGKMETWSAIEPPAGENPDIQNQDVDQRNLNELETQTPPPMVIPALIDRPNGIDDQNVAPIPTRPTDSIEGSAPESVATTIPVVPESNNHSPPMQLPRNDSRNDDRQTVIATHDDTSQTDVYDATPGLLTQPNDATLAATIGSNDNAASVWQIATAQLVATFLGVVLAVGLFLLIRVAAVQLFGTRLGVTFDFGSTRSASVSAETKSQNESADVVPFGVQSPGDATATPNEQPDETGRAGGVADPADFPFRVVGSSNGDDGSAAEGDLNQQQETAILRSVFDQNLDLMSELDKRNGSAA